MPDTISDSMRDPKTPEDVVITLQARKPETDPTLGIPVTVKAAGTPRNRLVTLGDSLTHGFQSGAIYNTDISYPALIAAEMGWYDSFRHPTYKGFGGLPLNIEFLVRDLEQELGDRLAWWELPLAAFRVDHFMAEVDDWWERGPGSVVPNIQGINHNLAVYGWDLRDTLSRNADVCRQAIQTPKHHGWFQLVENANERAALRVLQSAHDAAGIALTPPQAAAALGAEGTVNRDGSADDSEGDGIETLIVLLGANNALRTVVNLQVVWSADGYDDLSRKNQYTVWRPTHFQAELNQLVAEVNEIRARHVIWGTVPHVTIAPIARGVGAKVRTGSRFFPYYTRPWISDRDFDAKDDPCITEPEARAVDSAIDQYNAAITDAVRKARKQGKDWYLFDLQGLLDRLASRRYIEDAAARPDWWRPYELPSALQHLSPVPNSLFFVSGPAGRTQGGLFSLDGVHPTTIGYGIVAQEFIHVMQLAGVRFYARDGITERSGPVKVDFRGLIARDTLIFDPPHSVTSDLGLIGWADRKLDFFRRMLRLGG